MKMILPKRKLNRLENYDYGEIGCYFVTLCTQKRQHLFNVDTVGNDLCVVPQGFANFNETTHRLFPTYIMQIITNSAFLIPN